jgi:hypothetical protein
MYKRRFAAEFVPGVSPELKDKNREPQADQQCK